MNKLPLLLFLLILTSFESAEAQRIMGAAIFGVNASQVDGDEVYGYKNFGLNTGLSAIVPFNDKWAVSIENVYSEKGAHQRRKYLDSLDGSYDLKLNYLEVPVLLHFTDKDIVTFGAGMSWSRLIKVSEQRNSIDMPATTLESGIYNSSDINLLLDIRFRVLRDCGLMPDTLIHCARLPRAKLWIQKPGGQIYGTNTMAYSPSG